MKNIFPEHSRFSLSQSERWLNCPGSVNLIDQNPELNKISDSTLAEEGRKAHVVAAKLLREETLTHEEYQMDISDQEAITFFVDYVNILKSQDKSNTLYVEHPINISFHDAELYGRADAVIIGNKEAHIIDYKHGEHVDVDYPTQLKMYALMFVGALEPLDKIYLHFIQPRLPSEHQYRVKVWSVTPEELIQIRDEAIEAIKLTKHTVSLNVGKWCDKTFCSARGICPAYTEYLKNLLGNPDQLAKAPKAWSDESIRKILVERHRLKKIIETIENLVKLRITEDPEYKNKIEFETRQYKAGWGWKDVAQASQHITDLESYKLKTPKQVMELGDWTEEDLLSHDLLEPKTQCRLIDMNK